MSYNENKMLEDVDRLIRERDRLWGSLLWLMLIAILLWGFVFGVFYWAFSSSTAGAEELPVEPQILFDRLPLEHFDPDLWTNWDDISCRPGSHPGSCGGDVRCYPAACFREDGQNVCCREGL